MDCSLCPQLRRALFALLAALMGTDSVAADGSEPVKSILSQIRRELPSVQNEPSEAQSQPPATPAKSPPTASPDSVTKLSPLAPRPDWRELDRFQESISKQDFERLLETVFAPQAAWKQTIAVGSDFATVSNEAGQVLTRLRFSDKTKAVSSPRGGRRSQPGSGPTGAPLQGLHISIDPGHLGGDWSRVEERWYQIGDGKPVVEGDMTLLTAQLLRRELESLGAEVTLTREDSTPSTSLRPENLIVQAKASLKDQGKQVNSHTIRKESERLFYRTAEIRARAQKVNKQLRPDIVLALHFNAEPWGNPDRPTLVKANHLHLLITGGFTREELACEDQLFNMLLKLLNGSFAEEYGLAKSLTAAMSRETGLPPYIYKNSAPAVRLADSEYIWARNLLANRLFECPVVYLEPYVMNNQDVHARLQAGDYEGLRVINGKERVSIYREYVRGVVDGLIAYYVKKD